MWFVRRSSLWVGFVLCSYFVGFYSFVFENGKLKLVGYDLFELATKREEICGVMK